jgi:hypothetical protein
MLTNQFCYPVTTTKHSQPRRITRQSLQIIRDVVRVPQSVILCAPTCNHATSVSNALINLVTFVRFYKKSGATMYLFVGPTSCLPDYGTRKLISTLIAKKQTDDLKKDLGQSHSQPVRTGRQTSFTFPLAATQKTHAPLVTYSACWPPLRVTDNDRGNEVCDLAAKNL